MPYRRMARSRGRSANRRRLVWTELDGSGFNSGAIGHYTNIDLLGDYIARTGATAQGSTIVRTHLKLFITSAVAAGDGLKIGLTVNDRNQLTAAASNGPTAFINPVDYPYSDWMWIDRFGAHPHYSFNSENDQMQFDIRSKRKLHDIQKTLLFSVANTGAVASLTWSVYARVLLALP